MTVPTTQSRILSPDLSVLPSWSTTRRGHRHHLCPPAPEFRARVNAVRADDVVTEFERSHLSARNEYTHRRSRCPHSMGSNCCDDLRRRLPRNSVVAPDWLASYLARIQFIVCATMNSKRTRTSRNRSRNSPNSAWAATGVRSFSGFWQRRNSDDRAVG